ncbi:uncharacterized protein LOC134256405 [Saccostrea cucullata]|uniref:uncharacterized protein LOC134256405 n=1 Tax=Saccostrea cuccullata TaxID=36930 RepID=UPI002ED43AF5
MGSADPNISRKNKEREKNPVLREFLQQPLKQISKTSSSFGLICSQNYNLGSCMENIGLIQHPNNTPQEYISSTLDFSDMDDQSVLNQKYLVPDKPTPAQHLKTSEKTSLSVKTILKTENQHQAI